MSTIESVALTPLEHDDAMDLQATELERTTTLLRTLDDVDWGTRTDCPDWDVRRMYLHVLGACEAGASMRENAHQMRVARAYRSRHGGPLEAALSEVQVAEREEMSPAELVDRLVEVAPRTIRGRRRIPAPARNHVKLAIDGPVIEKWRLGYLVDTIYLRDLWMHRVDTCRATGRELHLTSDHDGRIIADVVGEWARRHGSPFRLELTGPAGGTFVHEPDAADAPTIEIDAVEFCRTLAGRAPAEGLLTTIVPF
jgi:uncharacterized protein (TIGR03083 family)